MNCDESQVVAIPADFGCALRSEDEVAGANVAARQSSSGLVGRETHACFTISKGIKRIVGGYGAGRVRNPGASDSSEDEDGVPKYSGCGSLLVIEELEPFRRGEGIERGPQGSEHGRDPKSSWKASRIKDGACPNLWGRARARPQIIDSPPTTRLSRERYTIARWGIARVFR